jgi:GNAT superfamily N-acetyltransferase
VKPDAFTIRIATPADALAVARVHVQAWHETYAGILPDALIAKFTVEERSAAWNRILCDPASFAGTALYAVEDGSTIVGFGACCLQRSDALKAKGYEGEIGALYLLRAFQNRGLGTALMESLAADLSGRGLRSASVWVLRENAGARQFYEHAGGEFLDEREEIHEAFALVDISYGWRDLVQLRAVLPKRRRPAGG